MALHILVCTDTQAHVTSVGAIPLQGGTWGNGRTSNNGLHLWAPAQSTFVADPGGTLDGIADFMAHFADPLDRWHFVDDANWKTECGWQEPPAGD